ncbi:hypothetical protein [uncultured Prevotella sp.]|uniref:hypothetical protein n=1 Tax=uncultured Prevotella sp. TaxID=159272 RepID=UPI00260AABD3|nr:hypothetical protein [uncultured Prevotella sp.]
MKHNIPAVEKILTALHPKSIYRKQKRGEAFAVSYSRSLAPLIFHIFQTTV